VSILDSREDEEKERKEEEKRHMGSAGVVLPPAV
jgi:hypothetical protein